MLLPHPSLEEAVAKMIDTLHDGILLASANSPLVRNMRFTGALFTLVWTAQAGLAPTLDVKIQTTHPRTGAWEDISGAAFTQVTTASGEARLMIYPGMVASANAVVNRPLPRNSRVVYTLGGADDPGPPPVALSYTFSLTMQYLQ